MELKGTDPLKTAQQISCGDSNNIEKNVAVPPIKGPLLTQPREHSERPVGISSGSTDFRPSTSKPTGANANVQGIAASQPLPTSTSKPPPVGWQRVRPHLPNSQPVRRASLLQNSYAVPPLSSFFS